eukprot:1288190-Ditylum_brightwellii.AAC.2
MAVFGNSWSRMEGCLIGGRGMAVGGSSSFEPFLVRVGGVMGTAPLRLIMLLFLLEEEEAL